MQIVIPLNAWELKSTDVIYFGDGLCFVVGVEIDTHSVTLVTEGTKGAQFIDYVDPMRQFTVVRTV